MGKYDVIKAGGVVFTGTFKECHEYTNGNGDNTVTVAQGTFNAQGALNCLEQLKRALIEADTFGYYQGEYELIRQFLAKAGETK